MCDVTLSICPYIILSLLLGTLFLSRSALLIMSLLSDPELKLTFSVLPINGLNLSFVICVRCSVLYQLCCWMSGCFVMFCQCSVTIGVTI